MMRKDLPLPEALPLYIRLAAATRFLGMSLPELSSLLGLSVLDGEKLIRGELACPSPAVSQEAEQIVALFKTLNRFIGKDDVAGRWLRTSSPAFNCKPIDLLKQPGGARLVTDYLKTIHLQA